MVRSDTSMNHLPGLESPDANALRRRILELVEQYYTVAHSQRQFVPRKTRVNYGGRVYDHRELASAIEACLDFWLTAGPNVDAFEGKLAEALGVAQVHAVNSGSSANLVAVSALCSRRNRRPLEPGDEVITPAMAFPTTVAPIVQNGLIPVFVDCDLGTYNLSISQLEEALSDRTRAVFFAHTLGNPVEMDAVLDFAHEHGLYVVEDACDALGSTYDGEAVGSFGDISTLSFYPAHHITTGEGGAVATNNPNLARIALSLRDWGRDCRCKYNSPPEGACGHRFDWTMPGLDEPYDHRYLFVEVGYNLKMTEIQAAIGLAQLDKLPSFISRRRQNFARLYEGLKPYEDLLMLPAWNSRADPAWFAFPLTVRSAAPFGRRDLTDWLEARNIETRLLFAGNIIQHPGYRSIRHRVVGDLANANTVMRSTFFVGVYPGLDQPRIDFMLEAFNDFFAHHSLQK
jgi:CDP-6-deoxy-D-xylo-4-hexulose-3-dehydrase